jgi:hypothetical protein
LWKFSSTSGCSHFSAWYPAARFAVSVPRASPRFPPKGSE